MKSVTQGLCVSTGSEARLARGRNALKCRLRKPSNRCRSPPQSCSRGGKIADSSTAIREQEELQSAMIAPSGFGMFIIMRLFYSMIFFQRPPASGLFFRGSVRKNSRTCILLPLCHRTSGCATTGCRNITQQQITRGLWLSFVADIHDNRVFLGPAPSQPIFLL